MAAAARVVVIWLLAMLATLALARSDSAANLVHDMYEGCLGQYSTSCVRPKTLAWLSRVAGDDEIVLTEDMSLVKTGEYSSEDPRMNRGDERMRMFDNIEGFLSTHTLKIRIPEELRSGDAGAHVPRSLLNGLPQELNVPLSEANEGRGIVKKVMIPFLVGLKFKTSVLVPLALALIALKTWKALTLGLISLVLTGAMVIFKFTKPKVVNYEVIHVPHHHHDAHVEHMPAPAGWGPYQRSFDNNPQEMAYNAYL